MKLEVLRFSSQVDSTSGLLFEITDVGRKFLCYTLEDERRVLKVKGETRVPAGTYKIELRKEGGFHARYDKKYPGIHRGMLHIIELLAASLLVTRRKIISYCQMALLVKVLTLTKGFIRALRRL